MAWLHAATITPPKAEFIAAWVAEQAWTPPGGPAGELVAAFRFDDPEGEVGIETHLVAVGDIVLQVPLTYRGAPLGGADDALVARIEHSALGTRWVYDGLHDPRYAMMLAAVTLTGQGEAIGMVERDGRWHAVPSKVRLVGGGWGETPVVVDGFVVEGGGAEVVRLVNEQLVLQLWRRPVVADRPAIGLTATWPGQPDPVVLASIETR